MRLRVVPGNSLDRSAANAAGEVGAFQKIQGSYALSGIVTVSHNVGGERRDLIASSLQGCNSVFNDVRLMMFSKLWTQVLEFGSLIF